MLPYLFPIGALLLGVALLLLGSGLLSTLLALRGGLEGYGNQLLGGLGSSYFVGFLVGTYAAPPLIRRIGHIRAFAFFTAAVACTVLLHGLLVNPWIWLGLRMLTGVALVALYTIIESWLNSQAPPAHRGQIFAVYMAVNLGALALAQQLLRVATPAGFTLFALAALLVCAAVMPVTATRLAQPTLEHTTRLTLRRLWSKAPVAVAGGLLSGLAMGAFWGLGAVYAGGVGLGREGIALFMSVAILGGALLQWPLGAFSDRCDRRRAIAWVAVIAACIAAVMAATAWGGRFAVSIGGFAYGGFAFALYPLAVAHLIDRLAHDEILSGSSGLLMVHGIGAALGPLLAGAAMERFGPLALPVWFAAMQAGLALFAWSRSRGERESRESIAGHPHFVPMVRTTPTALEMMPAAEATPEQETDNPLHT